MSSQLRKYFWPTEAELQQQISGSGKRASKAQFWELFRIGAVIGAVGVAAMIYLGVY